MSTEAAQLDSHPSFLNEPRPDLAGAGVRAQAAAPCSHLRPGEREAKGQSGGRGGGALAPVLNGICLEAPLDQTFFP